MLDKAGDGSAMAVGFDPYLRAFIISLSTDDPPALALDHVEELVP